MGTDTWISLWLYKQPTHQLSQVTDCSTRGLDNSTTLHRLVNSQKKKFWKSHLEQLFTVNFLSNISVIWLLRKLSSVWVL